MRNLSPKGLSAKPRASNALQWAVAALGLAYIVGLALSDPPVAKTLGLQAACALDDACARQRGDAALDSQAALN